MLDLTTPGALAQLSRQIKDEIDQYCEIKFDDGFRSHLGASEIGQSCSKLLWLKFRWTFYVHFDGRMQRLLHRGHFEEPKLKALVEGIGFTVREFDDAHKDDTELDKGKRQIRISACKGHFGGSVDGIGYRDDVGSILIEYKTQGLGKQGAKVSNFDKLVKEGVKSYKPVHFAQMSMYGYKLGLEHALYISVCKNDDNLHIELVKLDHFLGASLEKKAEMIIFSEVAPAGISMSQSYYECQYCDAKLVCHSNEPALVNCRSCRKSHPVDSAEWYCEQWDAIIPKDSIKLACEVWESII